MKVVYVFESKDYGALKKLLEEDPLGKESFPTVGYTLKESKAVGLKGGSYVVFLQSSDEELLKRLEAKLKALPTAKKADGAEFDGIVKKIEEEQEAAQAGFGSLFG